PGKIILFRPPLPRDYKISGNRYANTYREVQDSANHWRPYAQGGVEVEEVPGSHDSMVLEPQVRVLGAKVRTQLERAQQRSKDRSPEEKA
ncbi:MAG: thioesterase domain-containing protein, partial [Planctomycetota bacterium]